MAAKKDTVKVKIGFDPDPKKIGKEVELPLDEARVKVAEGRARYVGAPPAEVSTAPTSAPPLPEVAAPSAEIAAGPPVEKPDPKKS